MTIFMGVFLPFNEYTKVTELVKFYRGQRVKWFSLIFSFLLTVVLSVGGMYLWVNKSTSLEKQIIQTKIETSTKLQDELDSRRTKVEEKYRLSNDARYKQEYSNLTYYRTHVPYSRAERSVNQQKITLAETNIARITKELDSLKAIDLQEIKTVHSEYKTQTDHSFQLDSQTITKNNWLSWLLSGMTLLIDLMALRFARSLAEQIDKREKFLTSDSVVWYVKFRAFLGVWMLTKKVGDHVHKADIKQLNPDWDWYKELTTFFNLLHHIGIIELTDKAEGNFLLTRDEALNAFDGYYKEYLS